MNPGLEMTIEQTTAGATLTAPVPSRPTSSRKLLARKAIGCATLPPGDTLEASFPALASPAEDSAASLEGSSSSAPSPVPNEPSVGSAAWFIEDEARFQALSARRKAAGYQRRGKDVSAQVLRAGDLKPNADTVVATIVSIVAERGSIARSELIDLMAAATFPHSKARPTDKGWCQGYVGGAIRNGYLVVEHSTITAPGGEV